MKKIVKGVITHDNFKYRIEDSAISSVQDK